MKIAIVVHGRFHGFDLARALIKRGHEVTVFTNYPKWAAQRFDLHAERVRSFWPHSLLSRSLHQASRWFPSVECDGLVHPLFGRWAARMTSRETWDVIYAFSGVAEEILRQQPQAARQRWVARGSAHILTQDHLLAEEGRRAGAAIERPSQWMLRREQREYQLADRIVTLSSFSRNSFLEQGLPPERVLVIPSGIDLDAFRPTGETVAARCRRIRDGEPLRVLFAGTASLQKGIFDLVAVIERVDPRQFQFRLVSNVTPDAASLLKRVAGRIELRGRVPQRELPRQYEEADLFVFPTIQDGFAAVLAQANANALPIIATTNCAAPDLIAEGKTGWIVPIRQPEAIVERLRWCHEHRAELAAMVERIYYEFRPRTWDDVAADFERQLAAAMACEKGADGNAE